MQQFQWILPKLCRVITGKEMALAVCVLQTIAGTFGQVPPDALARFVYLRLPKPWRSPDGPASQAEILVVIKTGIRFYRAVRRVIT